ncbi:NAD(P)-dependent oxidoreductase [uncultured Microbacterium sp.]|uniref:NAD-dependent epimerase/dehydratase family protein n=1 Tax=uncultured Microbacterium sp. TaxID=191216 RepID=UPI0025FB7F87|nr:NAD(P)-dependent oxidoreductase [uncultured Microbacterium sp.]
MNSRSIGGARIVVTGGAGLIGRATVAALRDLGCETVSFDRLAANVTGVRDQPGDLRDAGAIRAAVEGADAVVHLGGIPGPWIEDEVTTYAVNAVGTLAVFAAAAEAGVERVVYASSINASGLPIGKLRAPSIVPYDEDEPPAFGDTYSLSKDANERAAVMAHATWGLELTGLRFPLVRDIAADEGRVFAAHIRRGLREDPIRQAYEGWSYLDVHDAARAVVCALRCTTPPAPGILVAAPTTYLRENTREAVARILPDVPVGELEGRQVGLDLTRSSALLDFRAERLLEYVSPDLLAPLGGTP